MNTGVYLLELFRLPAINVSSLHRLIDISKPHRQRQENHPSSLTLKVHDTVKNI